MTYAEGQGMGRMKASVSAADGGGKTMAPQAFMQDNCFLCSRKINETDPRQFYTGPPGSSGVMMLAHTGCLNKFKANGEQWPVEEPQADQPKMDSLAPDYQRVSYGNARLAFDAHSLVLLCNKEIAEQGLKAVIPDLVVALRAVLESL